MIALAAADVYGPLGSVTALAAAEVYGPLGSVTALAAAEVVTMIVLAVPEACARVVVVTFPMAVAVAVAMAVVADVSLNAGLQGTSLVWANNRGQMRLARGSPSLCKRHQYIREQGLFSSTHEQP